MPPIILAVVMAAASVWAGAASTASIVMAVVMVAAAAASYALQAKAKAPGFSSLSGQRMVTSRDSIRARELVYGTVRKGGLVCFPGTWDNNHWLSMVIALAGHPVEGIDEIYFGEELAFNAAGVGQGRFLNQTYVRKHLGATDQVADAYLISVMPAYWGSWNRLQGIAYIVVDLAYNPNVFRSVPNITAIVRGRKVYDPRTSTTVFSANPALCLADYLADTEYGLGAAYVTDINSTDLIAAANICDESVAIPNSGTELRYAANGILSSSEDPQANIEMLLSAMAGRCVYVGGQWIIKAGAYEAPTITLDHTDFRGALQVNTRQQRRDLCNAVRGVFVSVDRAWQLTDFPPMTSATFEAQDNGERIWRDVELPFTTSVTMAQRLAKIELYATREQIALTVPVSLTALRLRAGDTVALTHSRFGWTAKPFVITDWSIAASGSSGAPTLGCTLALRETSSAVYSITANEQDLIDAAPDSGLPDAFTVAAPSVVSVVATNQLSADGTILHYLTITWTAYTDGFVAAGGRIEVQYKKPTESAWTPAPNVPGSQTVTRIGPLEDGITYDVRLRAVNELGVASTWTTTTAAATVDTVAPGVPTSISATALLSAVNLRWTNPTDADLAYVEVWSSTTNDSNTSASKGTVRGTAFTVTGLVVNVPVYFWLKSWDRSGNASALTPSRYAGVTATPHGIIEADMDSTPPATPTGLALAGAVDVQADGTVFAAIDATWNANGEADIWGYQLDIRRDGSSSPYSTLMVPHPQTSYRLSPVLGAIAFEGRIAALDIFGNFSTFTSWLDFTTPGDTTAPAVPTSVTATAGFHQIVLQWTNPTAYDLAVVEIWRSASNHSETAVKVGEHRGILWTDTALANATPYWYWLKSRDTSGNVSAFHATEHAGATATTVKIDGTDVVTASAILTNVAQIQDALITSAKIISLSADKIATGTLSASLQIYSGALTLDGTAAQMRVHDGTRDRVVLGVMPAVGYGLWIYNEAGALMFSATDGSETAGIKPNAVTQLLQATGSSDQHFHPYRDTEIETEILNQYITTIGSPVMLVAWVDWWCTHNVEYIYLKIDRDSNDVTSRGIAFLGYEGWVGSLSAEIMDQPAAGGYTYRVYILVKAVYDGINDYQALHYNVRGLQLLELKR